MISHLDIRLATQSDAAEIAAMSRDYIEQGLPWTWTESRVGFSIASKETNVVVARDAGAIVGDVGNAPSGGSSLYLELRIDGRPVDPLQWLERR